MDATFKELEAIKMQRILQKRFIKAEVVQKELLQHCFSLLEYLQKMRECSYVHESVKDGKFGTNTVIRYYTNRMKKQIHEMDSIAHQTPMNVGR
mmetsp:Transcript_27017/g.33524  ORF Transcript_27017/g.33524 Transcript_27017/m.33524 type:complete len:94 (-) Transcript_27017:76-357(-)